MIAPLTPVSDERLVPVMVRLHRWLHDGDEPAQALALAAVSDDGLLDPTAGVVRGHRRVSAHALTMW